MVVVGYMPMPDDFKYKSVAERGKPGPSLKHPLMDTGHRAKIFAPFAALRGFDQAILSKDVQYEERRFLCDEDRNELNRRLNILHEMTFNSRTARENRPVATVTYFVICADRNSEAYGTLGSYSSVTDIVWSVDPVRKSLRIGKSDIRFQDIGFIEAKDLFDADWEAGAS